MNEFHLFWLKIRFAIFKANLEKYNDVNGKFNNEKSNTYLEINPYSDWVNQRILN